MNKVLFSKNHVDKPEMPHTHSFQRNYLQISSAPYGHVPRIPIFWALKGLSPNPIGIEIPHSDRWIYQAHSKVIQPFRSIDSLRELKHMQEEAHRPYGGKNENSLMCFSCIIYLFFPLNRVAVKYNTTNYGLFPSLSMFWTLSPCQGLLTRDQPELHYALETDGSA